MARHGWVVKHSFGLHHDSQVVTHSIQTMFVHGHQHAGASRAGSGVAVDGNISLERTSGSTTASAPLPGGSSRSALENTKVSGAPVAFASLPLAQQQQQQQQQKGGADSGWTTFPSTSAKQQPASTSQQAPVVPGQSSSGTTTHVVPNFSRRSGKGPPPAASSGLGPAANVGADPAQQGLGSTSEAAPSNARDTAGTAADGSGRTVLMRQPTPQVAHLGYGFHQAAVDAALTAAAAEAGAGSPAKGQPAAQGSSRRQQQRLQDAASLHADEPSIRGSISSGPAAAAAAASGAAPATPDKQQQGQQQQPPASPTLPLPPQQGMGQQHNRSGTQQDGTSVPGEGGGGQGWYAGSLPSPTRHQQGGKRCCCEG
jgi:hypothetical protein